MIIGKISLNSKCIRINIDGKYQTKVIAGYNHRPFLASAFQDTFAQKKHLHHGFTPEYGMN